MLRNLDQDLISSEHILNHQQLQQEKLETYNTNRKRKLEGVQKQDRWKDNIFWTSTNKWPTFDDMENYTVSSLKADLTQKKEENSNGKFTNQKSFAYHKVRGKPAHLKKNPTAYIAVSAISPKPSEPEEDFLLETELHQLKPWKNKRSSRKM